MFLALMLICGLALTGFAGTGEDKEPYAGPPLDYNPAKEGEEYGKPVQDMTEAERAEYAVSGLTRAINYNKYALVIASGNGHTVYSSANTSTPSGYVVDNDERVFVYHRELGVPQMYYIRFKTPSGVQYGYVETSKIFIPTSGYTRPIRSGTIGARHGGDHLGIDVGAASGTPVYAVDSGSAKYLYELGKVENSSVDQYVYYGKHIELTIGTKICVYAHLSGFNGIVTDNGSYSSAGYHVGKRVSGRRFESKGTVNVTQDQIIGKVGTTGNSTGNHLHFEIKQNGTSLDPFSYVIFPDIGY